MDSVPPTSRALSTAQRKWADANSPEIFGEPPNSGKHSRPWRWFPTGQRSSSRPLRLQHRGDLGAGILLQFQEPVHDEAEALGVEVQEVAALRVSGSVQIGQGIHGLGSEPDPPCRGWFSSDFQLVPY